MLTQEAAEYSEVLAMEPWHFLKFENKKSDSKVT